MGGHAHGYIYHYERNHLTNGYVDLDNLVAMVLSYHNMRLWLVGSAGKVELVILLKWTKAEGNFVKGKIETWGMDSEGSEVLLQREEIFPEPQTGSSDQVIRVTRKQLFGSTLPAGRNPDYVFGLSVSNLRSKVAIATQHDGYRPASSTSTTNGIEG
ncbi:hypothetical protein I7I50_08142 [Histoplasma capsulatum G186AR]|uniref:Uncharacterized protein n=1 Tax=Ajellomyces capsulatus TaxID=5037 RepID=A0A8H7YK97_AJECA|nr:hypothetical protein I7I52_08658 [Histoplasma capsulatum]QSS68660.1 hypothetical protein I7I50_08142 [Histoplasma capsulatum G186AR]